MLIPMKRRPLTTLTSSPFYPLLSRALLEALGRIAALDTVRSVSCPFRDPAAWRVLVAEQRRRAEGTERHPQLVFGLSGPDAGLPHVPLDEWGGHVHIPYEGAAPADCFIRPSWRLMFPEYGGRDGSLSAVVHGLESPGVGYFCHHLLTNEDLGELACAEREELGEGWIHYASKRPYLESARRWTRWAVTADAATVSPWST